VKFTLRSGAELETLTRDELNRELELFGDANEKRAAGRVARQVRGPGDWQETDANGGAVLVPYRVPNGCTFTLHHVVVTAEGASVSVPYKLTPVAVEIRRDEPGGDLIDFAPEPDEVGQLPTIVKRIGYPFRNGERVVIVVVDAAANTRVYANVTGTLRRGE
jgi:hypothetical protein